MAWLDLIIILLIGAVVVSRFMGFKLPTDKRDAATRKREYEQLFGRRRASREAHDNAREVKAKQRQQQQAEDPWAEAPEPEDNVIDLADLQPEPEATPARPPRRKPLQPRDVAHLSGLEQIKALDPEFDEDEFLEGAAAAYQYFYDCYNARDTEGIINLCSPQLEQDVIAEWDDNPPKVVVTNPPEAVLGEARLHGRTAVIEVAFKALQKVGKTSPKTVTSRWVFARAIGSPDPNWELQSLTPQSDA